MSFNKLIKSIERSKKITLEKFIYSLGIRFIGEINSEILAKAFENIDDMVSTVNKNNNLHEIDGLGPKAISALNEFFSNKNNLQTVSSLKKILTIIKPELSSQSNYFTNKNIVFTGTLTNLSRDEAKYLVKKNGAKILSSVTKNTDYLIIGEKAGSKVNKAKLLGIKIIKEDEFLLKINQ